jgi:hypothetical protein
MLPDSLPTRSVQGVHLPSSIMADLQPNDTEAGGVLHESITYLQAWRKKHPTWSGLLPSKVRDKLILFATVWLSYPSPRWTTVGAQDPHPVNPARTQACPGGYVRRELPDQPTALRGAMPTIVTQNAVIRRRLVDYFIMQGDAFNRQRALQLILFWRRRHRAYVARIAAAHITPRSVGPVRFARGQSLLRTMAHPSLPADPMQPHPGMQYSYVSEGMWFDCIYTHRTAPGCPFVLDPTARIVADYPGPGRRPRLVMEDLEGAMQFRNHAPIFVSAESGATWTIDTGLTRSFLTPQAIMFNIQHLEVEQVMEQVVTDGQGRVFPYSSVVRIMRVTVKDAYGEITLCMHLPNVALLTQYPDPSVWGSLGRDWAAVVQAVADRDAPIENFDSTSHWQGGDVFSAGFGKWQLTQPQVRGHVVRVPYQQLQVFQLPESHPVLNDPQCTNRELFALMENVLPTTFHLMPLAFSFEMVPQLLWVAHAAHRDREATDDADFQTPSRRMRAIPANLTANPLLFHHHHYPALPATAFGDLGVDVPAPAFFLTTTSIPPSLYPLLRAPLTW